MLDILVTSRRDTKAATRFFRMLLTGLEYVPRVLVTDKLGSYQAARRRVARSVEHRLSKHMTSGAAGPAYLSSLAVPLVLRLMLLRIKRFIAGASL